MTGFPLDLDRFSNADPNFLTIVVIGTESNLQACLFELDRLGFADRAAWTRIMPLPHQPDKSISLLNQFIPPIAPPAMQP